MITFKHRGNFVKTERFFKGALTMPIANIMNQYGKRGVVELSRATPKDTGLTSTSWSYAIEKTSRGYRLSWMNSEMAGNTPLVILLQYGHGTGTGGYVPGRDFINPAIRPILDKLADDLISEVNKL